MIFRTIFLILLFIPPLISNAQKPYWVDNLPTAPKENYYYRVTCAESMTYKEAYVEAFSIAVLESSWKMGVLVNSNEDLSSMKKNISSSLEIEVGQAKISLNKVCEYRESLSSRRGVRLYVLWQVAKYGNINPDFKEFSNCNKKK